MIADDDFDSLPRRTQDVMLRRRFPIYHPPTDRAPVVLALRIGDWCGLIDGQARIVAQMEPRPVWELQGFRR